MKKLVMAAVLGASMLTSACAYNMAVRKESDRIYPNTTLKAATLTAVQAISESNMAIQSSTTPVTGMVVISARGTAIDCLKIAAPTLTLMLAEVEPNRIRVDATALLPGQTSDFGLTDHMVETVLKAMDAKLDPASRAPRKL